MANNNVDDDGVSTDVIGNFNDDDDDDDLGEKVYAETRTALEILRCPISSPCFICTPATPTLTLRDGEVALCL